MGKKIVLLLLLLGLCGCAQSEDVEKNQDMIGTEQTVSGENADTFAGESANDSTGESSSGLITDTTGYGARTEPLALTQISEEPTVLNDILTFGQMQMNLPANTDITIVTLEDGSEAVSLEESDNILPFAMYLRHYQAAWQESAAVNELVWTLMEMTGAEAVTCRHMDWEKKELTFLFTTDYKDYYAFVKGEDIYLAEENDRKYSLEWRMYDGGVCWADTGEDVVLYGDINREYVRIPQPDGNTFFLISGDESSAVYKEGYFEVPVDILDKGIAENAGDVNFDGYADLGTWGKGYYLYQPATEQFEKAFFSTKTDGYEVNRQFFAEEQTIWTASGEYQEESPYDVAFEHEYLWQWEGNTLKLVRECATAFLDGTVQLYATEGEEVLFDATTDREHYEMDTAWAQSLMMEFYAGYVPAEVYYILHEAPGEMDYIPQSLPDLLADALLTGEIQSVLEDMMNDRALTEEEIAEYAGVNAVLLSELGNTELMGSYRLVLADIDNDGIEDILSEEYFGGTAGFTEFVCFKGMEDGSFQRTSRYTHVMEEFGIISYEGRNYLCRTSFDYNKKVYNGLDLFCYEEGARVEEVRLRFTPDGYMVTVMECLNDYLDYVNTTLSVENCVTVYENIEASLPVMGNVEAVTENGYQSDINNDGVCEEYEKYIRTPSNMGTESMLNFACESLPVVEDVIYSTEEGGTPMMMWVDEHAGQNIMNILYRVGLYDFCIVGVLVEGEDYEQLYRIESIANNTVTEKRIYIYEVPGEEAYLSE